MTLKTRIYLDGPIGGRHAFNLALTALCEAAGEPHRVETAQIEEERRNDRMTRSTTLGQGLPGITECKWCPDGPLSLTDVWTDHEDPQDRWLDQRACGLELNWDTAYGYRDERGQGCADLHSAALVLLERSLPTGVTLRWVDEFTDQEYQGASKREPLPVRTASEGQAA